MDEQLEPCALKPETLDRLILAAIATGTLVRAEDIGRRSHLAGCTTPQQLEDSLARLEAAGLVSRTVITERDRKTPLFRPQTETFYEANRREGIHVKRTDPTI